MIQGKNMSVIGKLMSRIVKGDVPKVIYGRWGTNYNSSQLNTRIDLANEDHCGPCGTYRLTMTNKEQNLEYYKQDKEKVTRNNNTDDIDYYVMAWEHTNAGGSK